MTSSEYPDIPERAPELPAPPASEPPAPESRQSGLGRQQKAWLGMAAVLVALVLLAILPETGPVDPNAPPPAADGGNGAADELVGAAAVGQDAPLHFTLKDSHGVDVNLASFKGKVILVNFWATWCGPCRVEIPDLMALQNEYPDDLVVLGISVLDEFDRVAPFAESLKVNYPMLDGNNRDDVEKAFGPMWGLPTTVIIGRDGKVHKRHAGIGSKEQFTAYVKSLL